MLSQKQGKIHYDSLTKEDFLKVANFIETLAGIRCPPAKSTLIEGRLRKRQRALGFARLKDYIHYTLDSEEGEHESIHLLDAVTTNKTDFYRENVHFSFLRSWINQYWHNSQKGMNKQALRCWSAGCSTGEEPYTLAFELCEAQQSHKLLEFSILATDISLSCLKKARSAVYPHASIESVPMNLRRRYLLRHRDNKKDLIKIAPEIRQTVNFEAFNLLRDNYEDKGKFDVIFCRNVMIYFNNTDREFITYQFSKCLKTNGLLIIGHSETLVGNQDWYQRLQPTIYQYKQKK